MFFVFVFRTMKWLYLWDKPINPYVCYYIIRLYIYTIVNRIQTTTKYVLRKPQYFHWICSFNSIWKEHEKKNEMHWKVSYQSRNLHVYFDNAHCIAYLKYKIIRCNLIIYWIKLRLFDKKKTNKLKMSGGESQCKIEFTFKTSTAHDVSHHRKQYLCVTCFAEKTKLILLFYRWNFICTSFLLILFFPLIFFRTSTTKYYRPISKQAEQNWCQWNN